MEKIILVDGNNLLFRSYYATAYNGNFMKNSKGFPTNGLFGFVNMMNKIILEEKPVYMIVAFDKGKTFRHDKFENYKDGFVFNELESKFTDYFYDYDYVLGDWAYGKLRLKGFCDKQNKIRNNLNSYDNINSYIKEYCSFECQYFILKKIKENLTNEEK